MGKTHFHLTTLLVATTALSYLVGVNMTNRSGEVVHFGNARMRLEKPVVQKSELYMFRYCHTPLSFGWPATWAMSRPPLINFNGTIDEDPIDEVELAELNRLAAVSDMTDWNGNEFQTLAPTIHKNLSQLAPKLSMSPFAPICTRNFTKLAMNVVVAFSITFALAATCEVFLRRKKKTPPVG